MNSLGYEYAEQCVNCEHSSLCFRFLELAGDITRPGQPIFSRCVDVRANPEKMQKALEERIARWRNRIARTQGGSTTCAEGWKEIF